MTSKTFAWILILGGTVAVSFGLLWWIQFSMVGWTVSKGGTWLPWSCSILAGGDCSVIETVAASAGVAPYDPTLLRFGGLVTFFGIVCRLMVSSV